MGELPERLREAADAHRPDRERILARMDRAMSVPAQRGARPPDHRSGPVAPWVRVTAVTAAVAGAIGLGGLAVGAVTGDGAPPHSTASAGGGDSSRHPAPATPSGGSGGSNTETTQTGGQPHRTAPTTTGPHATGTTPAPGRTASPPLDPAHSTPPVVATLPGTTNPGTPSGTATADPDDAADGVSCAARLGQASNPYWTQSDLTLTTTRPLTSLTVELRVARTGGVSSTGSYSSVSGQTMPTVTTESDFVVYRWVLNAGQTLAPGTYTFAGQFNHDGGPRSTSGDHFLVTGGGPDGTGRSEGGF
jgi:hypothetical protein